ncbi:hypothetical protein [Shewanella halifaxensis]|uniref:hypothetical protein n=1 Tax=Shewanella halifaxensis TaxID=271098 RepID=UPI000D598449|nr:hypothetical protein [Shewanella halifaxensis]
MPIASMHHVNENSLVNTAKRGYKGSVKIGLNSLLVCTICFLNMQLVNKAYVNQSFSSATPEYQQASLYAKGRYKAGLICKDKGWEFCASWATLARSPGSRLA